LLCEANFLSRCRTTSVKQSLDISAAFSLGRETAGAYTNLPIEFGGGKSFELPIGIYAAVRAILRIDLDRLQTFTVLVALLDIGCSAENRLQSKRISLGI
jgi:hypothetical protein